MRQVPALAGGSQDQHVDSFVVVNMLPRRQVCHTNFFSIQQVPQPVSQHDHFLARRKSRGFGFFRTSGGDGTLEDQGNAHEGTTRWVC